MGWGQIATTAVFWSVTIVAVALWARIIHRSGGNMATLIGTDISCRARWGLLDVLLIGFLWIFFQVAAVTLVRSLSGQSMPPASTPARLTAVELMASSAGQIALALAALVYLRKFFGHAWSEFGLADHQTGTGIRAGLSGFVLWMPAVWTVQMVLVQWFEYHHDSLDVLQSNPRPWDRAAVWFGAVIAAPVCEEVLFRGILQGWLQRAMSRSRAGFDALFMGEGRPAVLRGEGVLPENKAKPEKQKSTKDSAVPKNRGGRINVAAISVTSLAFALVHGSQGPAPVSLFLLSMGIGYLYQRTGSLLACIVMHFLLNLITMILVTMETVLG